jgi:hypothetical protein
MTGVLIALAWCVLALGAQVAQARSRGRGSAFAPAAGNQGAGVAYAFTGGMAPWAKESVRLNPGSYALGMVFHLGVFAAFLTLAWPGRVPALLSLMGALAGLGLLGKRLFTAQLRSWSNGDDVIANALVTVVCAVAGATLLLPSAQRALPWAVIALLVYIPLGKIRHCVFFFLSRYHFGAFFGRRGTFPPGRS